MTDGDVPGEEAQVAVNFVGWGKRQEDFVIRKPVSLEGGSIFQRVAEDSVALEQAARPGCLILGLILEGDLVIRGLGVGLGFVILRLGAVLHFLLPTSGELLCFLLPQLVIA